MQAATAASLEMPLAGLDAIFESARKITIIRLRWPLVILCSYLLLYAPADSLTTVQAHGLLLFYLFTNATLYFVEDDRFSSPSFYGPLVMFDTFFLIGSVTISRGASTDFFVACFLTLILSCVAHDVRGLIVVTVLAPLLYGYVLFRSAEMTDPTIYLRLPFPFVIAMFYGYFAQVERLRKTAKEREEQAFQRKLTAEQIRCQRDRLEVLHEINLAVTSTLDLHKLLDIFLDKALSLLPYSAADVLLANGETGKLEAVLSKHRGGMEDPEAARHSAVGQSVAEPKKPLIITNLLTDPRTANPETFRRQGLVSYLRVPLIAKGEVLGVLAFYTDEEREFSREETGFILTLAGQAAIAIQHSQLYEQRKKQAVELEKANKVKDEFLGIVSHELRTPLNVISGYTTMLTENMLGEVSPIQVEALHTISRQSRDLQNMIGSILQVSSLEADKVIVDMREIHLWEFFHEMKSCYEAQTNGGDIEMIWDYPSDLPLLITDPGKLKHILQNLINNALKFTQKGTVVISARHFPKKEILEFKVKDSGIGISKEMMPTIFEKFHQVDSSETRGYGGVGLGLYIVKKFTELIGGTVEVQSELGKGSTFTIKVPCKGQKSANTRATDPPSVDAGR